MPHPVLILGATGGVGSALASRLTERGYPLFLAARRAGPLEALARDLGAGWATCDVGDPASIAECVRQAAPFGGLSGLAYCVGSIDLKPLEKASADDYRRAFDLNVVGAAMAVQAARSALTSAKGSVVLFSSIAASQGYTNHSVIAAAKGGVEALVRSLAAELAPHVRVNGIAPSLTRTPLAAALLGNEAMAQGLARLHPLPRLGEALDMAAAATFLLEPDSGWITGQILPVDGGRSSLRPKG